MSEVDPEREVEDFFNEEILGQPPERPEPQPDFPTEAPPEPKPFEEIQIEEQEPERTPEVPEEVPVSPETPPEQEGIPEPEETPEIPEDYLAWARKQYGEDLDPEKLAKAAFEKEKLLGKQAEETRRMAQEREAWELQARIDALTAPGSLSPEEDQWVDEVIATADPGEYAWGALQEARPELYDAILSRWGSLGETESRRMRVFEARVHQALSAPPPDPTQVLTGMLNETFASLGLDLATHGPIIGAKADELGMSHPAAKGLTDENPDVRAISVRALYDLVSAGNGTVAKARQDDVVAARVQEEQLRQAASGVTTGGPHVKPPKRNPFWEEFEAEIEDRGWDGERPSYGREE